MQKNNKYIFCGIVLLLIIVGYNVLSEDKNAFLEASKIIVEDDDFLESIGVIESVVYYGSEYLEDAEKIILLEDMARTFGITEDLIKSVSEEENRRTLTLSKKGVLSETVFGIITLAENNYQDNYGYAQYITCKISIDNSPESLCHYAEVLESYLGAKGLSKDVTISLVSSFGGELEIEKRSEIADKILESMNAKVVAENRTKELFSVYAYSLDIASENVISLGSDKINLNIAVNYDERSDRTRVYLAAPLINVEY